MGMISTAAYPEPLLIMGVPVVPFESYGQVVACVEDIVRTGRKSFFVAVNPEKVYRAVRDPRLLAILRGADAGLCDGIGVALAVRLLYGRGISRCTGCDLFFHLVAAAAEKGWRVFLLGASPESNALACSRLRSMYPGLQIVGGVGGYFEDSQPVVNRINASSADLLFVGMGSPKQEFWIAEHRPVIQTPFCMGVGGTFDVVSGKARRAPKVFRRTGTEFLFRLVTSPSRWRRQMVLPVFLLAVLRGMLSKRESIG